MARVICLGTEKQIGDCNINFFSYLCGEGVHVGVTCVGMKQLNSLIHMSNISCF